MPFCANRALPPAATAAVYAAIMNFEKLADVRAVNNAMTAESGQKRTATTAQA